MKALIGVISQKAITIFRGLNMDVALTDNNGTQYYAIPCGVASDAGLVLSANNGSKYFYREANDYILYGQATYYPQPSANSGLNYYFYQCNVPSSSGLDLNANNGSKYYYSSAFNCVGWCDSQPVVTVFYNDQLGDPFYDPSDASRLTGPDL